MSVRSMGFRRVVVVFPLGLAATGCASLWGFDDLTVASEAGAGDSGTTTSDGPADAATMDSSAASDVRDAGDLIDGQVDSAFLEASSCDASVMHTDGIGQTWTDCTPLGTYDETEATAACDANASGNPCVANDCSDAGQAICDVDPHSPGYCSCWVFSGALAGHVNNTAACSDPSQASCVGSDTWN